MSDTKEINVHDKSSVDMMAAAIAAELTDRGRVTLKTVGNDALYRAISSVNLAKNCMPDYNITLGKAVSHGGNVTMLFNAQRNVKD